MPAGVDTVFVVNKAQWERVHGANAVGTALTQLDGLMAALATDGHPSEILQVDADPDVQTAVTRWNACPTEVTRGNAVMREIRLAIDAFARRTSTGVALHRPEHRPPRRRRDHPAARLEDRTTVANEDRYAETFGRNSELSTALRLSYFLSDDPYGDVDPIPFFDRQLHVPDVAVGRLPTSPSAAASGRHALHGVRRAARPGHRCDVRLRLPQGRAEQVDAALRAIPGVVGSNVPGLIGDTWSGTPAIEHERHGEQAVDQVVAHTGDGRRGRVVVRPTVLVAQAPPQPFEV